MGKKFNNIKPGTICTLVHNDSLIFRITHIDGSGYPFAKHSLYCYSTWDEFQLDKKPICMAYTTEYKEATKEQKEKFIMAEVKEVNIANFKNALHKGVVEFKYKKKNGEFRSAKGTLNIDIMGENNAPKGTCYDIIDNNIRYYDLNSEGWRSFIPENLIEWSKN
jgi:hypothetical protein